ncbi:MAG: DUF2147 domain-containing protein [Chromatiales bacterium]
MRFLRFVTVFVFLAPAWVGADITPEGRWKVVSDEDQRPVAIMKIYEENGEYRGIIDEILGESGQGVSPLCDNCPGSLKGEPIKGLVVLQGLKWVGDQYAGGHILDPDSGHYYRLTMTVGPDGNTLFVRGYLGVPLLGRTQTWYRVE